MPETILDISPCVDESLAVWPGDSPLVRRFAGRIGEGDSSTTSSLTVSAHAGAHADAPGHVLCDGLMIDKVPLDVYVGKCQVMHVKADPGGLVNLDMLVDPIEAPRLLLATGTYPDHSRFSPDFAALEPDLIFFLQNRGVRLIGIDTPSIDSFTSHGLEAHHACMTCGIAILENLVLAHVPDGLYELIALPLKLVGFDASPVRAVLRTL